MNQNRIINFFLKTILVITVAFILTAIYTWPFVINLNSFYYDRGDYQLSGANLAYDANAILSGKILNSETYFNGYQYYPQPYTLLYSDLRLLPSFIFLPVNIISNNFIFSVNSTTFLSFVLSFISAFYVILYFLSEILPQQQTQNRKLLIFLSCLIGSTVFTFNQLTFARLPEHFELLNKCFLPLIFLFIYKFIKNPCWINSFLFFISFLLNALSAVYYFTFSLIILPFFAIPILIHFLKKSGLLYFFKLLKFSLIGLLIIPFLIYFYNPYNEFSNKENVYRTLNQSAYFSARLIDFVSSSKTNLLYGNFSKDIDNFRSPKDNQGNFNYIEHNLSPGIFPVLLFVLVIILLIKKKLLISRYLLIGFLLTLGISFILTLGPFYQGWNNYQGNFPLPFYFFYESLSFFKSIRAPTRALFFFYVPFSIFTSIGVYFVLKWFKKPVFMLFVVLAFLMIYFLETYDSNFLVSFSNEKSQIVPQITKLMEKQPFFNSLQGKKTIHFPIYYPEAGFDSAYLNWSAITHEIVMNGNSGYLPSDQSSLLLSIKDRFDENMIRVLKAVNLDYIIVHKDMINNLAHLTEFSNLYKKNIIYEDDKIIIFDVKSYSISLNLCNFPELPNLQLNSAYNQQTLQLINFIILDNKSDCYLVNLYKNKYKQLSTAARDIYGNQSVKNISVKYPVLINPNEKIILSEENLDIKIH